MAKEKKRICRICKKEIKPPECYWKTFDCCSACIRKAAKEIQNPIKSYTLYIRSHSPAPDYESTIEAKDLGEAIEIFLQDPALIEWDESIIRDKIMVESVINKE